MSALGDAIGLSQSALSQHWRGCAPTASSRRDASWQTIDDSLESEGARKLIELLYQLYCAPECGVEPKAENKERRSDDDRQGGDGVRGDGGSGQSRAIAVAQPYWLLLTAFVGLNMLQASFTGFCPAAIVLRRFGVRAGCAFE